LRISNIYAYMILVLIKINQMSLNQEQINQLEIGDKIEIVTFHYMEGRIHTTRIIRDVDFKINGDKKIYVKCFGWDRFILKDNEILNKIY